MKYNDINPTKQTAPQNMENLFNVYVDEDGFYFYNLNRTIYFPEDLDASYYTIYITVPGDTWPLISFKHYNTIKLYWVILSVNQIINPVEQPLPGTPIKVLSPSIVSQVITDLIKA